MEFEFPTKSITESALMLEDIVNEKGELPENFDEVLTTLKAEPTSQKT